jgi:hypothetical protein
MAYSRNNHTESDDFLHFYNKELSPQIKAMDELYRAFAEKKRRRIILSVIIALLSTIVLVFAIFHVGKVDPELAFGIGFPAFIIGSVAFKIRLNVHHNKKALFKKIRYHYKRNVVGKYCQEYFDHFSYLPHQHVGKARLFESLLYNKNTDVKGGEDFFRFYIDNIMIQFSEVAISYHRNSTPINHFFVSVEFNKPFKVRTVVIPETKRKFKKGIEANSLLFGYRDKIRNLQLVELEPSEFEDNFVVYSDSQIEARYLLSPALMQKLVKYVKDKSWKIYLSFYDNRLYFRFDAIERFFEPDYHSESFGSLSHVRRDLSIIWDIIDVIDVLNLERSIWRA